MNLVELLTLPARLSKLEKEHIELIRAMISLMEAYDHLEMDHEDLLLSYQSHLYHNYHGVENLSGEVVFSKPKISEEDDFKLRALREELKAKMRTKLQLDSPDQ